VSIASLGDELMEMSGILLLLEKMWGNCPLVREIYGKISYQGKLFIVNFTFGVKPVFSGIIVS